MKVRDKILYMSFGAGLVILGMLFNLLFPFLVTHAVFTDVRYRNLTIEDKNGQITLATMKEGYIPWHIWVKIEKVRRLFPCIHQREMMR